MSIQAFISIWLSIRVKGQDQKFLFYITKNCKKISNLILIQLHILHNKNYLFDYYLLDYL